MTSAAARLGPRFRLTYRHGDRAGLAGWHEVFDPINPFDLLMINSSGSPDQFNLAGGQQGQTADIPETGPTAILLIHSYSAASPADVNTIAGRWLANGAFLYFGAVDEPFLHSFRKPSLVATFLAENLPVVTAVRATGDEVFGWPWRQAFFGDPLYRLQPVGRPAARIGASGAVASWPAYGEYRQPPPEAPDAVRLNWALKTTIFLTQTGTPVQQRVDLAGALLDVSRDRLEPPLRPLYDDLLVDTLIQARKPAPLIDRLSRVPPAERSPSLRRHLETAQMAALNRATLARDARAARALWTDVIRDRGPATFARTFTQRVGRLMDGPVRLGEWRSALKAALKANPGSPHVGVLEEELKRVEEQLKPRPGG
jgi:hypothetical protein